MEVSRSLVERVYHGNSYYSQNMLGQEEKDRIGRVGEEFVFHHLQEQYASNPNVVVEWLNSDQECGGTYDICVKFYQPGTQNIIRRNYIEVKSTKNVEKDIFEISGRQWDFAVVKRADFLIYRVYSVLDPNNIRLQKVEHPAQLWREGKIRVCLVL
eukprot:TRINITY_DN4013_c0_g1_i2.p1 TRINITY_DN4013_c0_g1~~TRINITY_DN4013_c0_g1_i2.p1  ORF type:complete len:156 (+),score=22.76 TRINITY_DN4013_c0_g1_i2:185-652(+)